MPAPNRRTRSSIDGTAFVQDARKSCYRHFYLRETDRGRAGLKNNQTFIRECFCQKTGRQLTQNSSGRHRGFGKSMRYPGAVATSVRTLLCRRSIQR